MEKNTKLEKINIDFAKKYIDKYNGKNLKEGMDDEYKHYRNEDKVVRFLFLEAYPNNTVYEEILAKVLILNVFYSTRIMAPKAVAQKISDCKIDKRIQKGDTGVVNDIAQITFQTKTDKIKERCFYSFATKYCCNSNPESYPIYDKNVAYILKQYKKQDKFCKFKNDDLKDYNKFKEIINKFRDYYGLNELNYRDLDRFLWIYGNEKLAKK